VIAVGPRASRFALLFLVLGFLALLVAKNWHSHGGDFEAFYNAGARLWAGESPYRLTDELPFKYAPFISLLMVPLSWLPYDLARWVFLALEFAAFLALPLTFLRSRSRPASEKALLAAAAVATLGALRFLDNEFHVSQVNLISYFLVWMAWLTDGPRPRARWGSAALFAAGALFKFHPLLLLLPLFLRGRQRTALRWAAATFLLALLPHPGLWRDFWNVHVERPIPMATLNTILQGFFPLLRALGLSWLGGAPLAVALVALALWRTPKLRATSTSGPRLAVLAWLLIGAGFSPIPWQHTYSLVFSALFAGWLLARDRAARGLLLAAALALGVTARGVGGRAVALAAEHTQLIYFCALLIAGTLLVTAARLSTSEPLVKFPSEDEPKDGAQQQR